MGRRRHLHMTDMYERVANDQSLPKFTSEQFAAMPAHEQHRHGIRVLAAMLDQRDPAGASLVQHHLKLQIKPVALASPTRTE